jgi:uncharacterized protein
MESRLCAFGDPNLSLPKRATMITVISPAKTLDFDTPPCTNLCSSPEFLDEAGKLIHKLRTLSKKKLMDLMDISADLAALNFERYLSFEPGLPVNRSKQAVLAFHGDVYLGMEATEFEDSDFEFAQENLRILSGLYGVLRPLDLIQPHRLEMGTQLAVGRRKNLHRFWNDRVTPNLNAAIDASSGDPILLNLASQEYFGSIALPQLRSEIVTPIFLDQKGTDYKVVSFWAKKARGKMAAWIINNRIDQVAAIKEFDGYGYQFNAAMSTPSQWAFTRAQQG